MAPHQDTRSLRPRRNRKMSLASMIRISVLSASILGFAYLWGSYMEMSSSSWGGSSVAASSESLGMNPPAREEKFVRGVNLGRSAEVAGQRKEASMSNEQDSTASSTTSSSSISNKKVSNEVGVPSENSDQNRLYCMIPFIWTPSAFPAYHAIRSTWGKRCRIAKFFIDPVIGDSIVGFYNMSDEAEAKKAVEANLTLPDDVVILHSMKRPWHTCSAEDNKKGSKPIGNCRNIWEKIWRAWVYTVYGTGGAHVNSAVQNENGKTDVYNAEWFVKVDADTYLFPENLPRYVESKGWSYNDQHYFGHVLNHRQQDRKVSIVAGAAVFFSRATLLEAAKTFNTMSMERGDQEEDGTCRDAYTGTEEVVTAVCIKDFVQAEPALDADGREEVSLYEVDLILQYNRTEQGEWWYWAGKQRVPCHDNPNDCLSHLPLAFHHLKNAKDMLKMDKEFYGDDASTRDKRQGYVNEYFEKIRVAMKVAEAAESTSVRELGSDEPVSQHNLVPKSPTNNNRLYCMVPFIWTPKFQPQYHAIRETWGNRCDVIRFFIDPIIGDSDVGFQDLRVNKTAKESLPDDLVVIEDIKRPWNECARKEKEEITCRNIWEKLWRSWLWMGENGELDNAEWFTKVDADTYLFADHLKHYVNERNWSPSDQHYFGHVLMHRIEKSDADTTLVAGAAVFFSRTTMKSLAETFKGFKEGEVRSGNKECKDAYTSEEEVVTARCLKENFGVEAETTLDKSGKELIAIGEVADTLLWNRAEQGEWWYWENKPKVDPKTGGEIHQCCSDLPIAFHGYKDPQWFYLLENEFYGTNFQVEESRRWMYNWRNPEETKPYFERVRKAMKDVGEIG